MIFVFFSDCISLGNFKDLDSFPPLMIWKRELEVAHLKFKYVIQKEHLDGMEITSLTKVL